MPEGKSFWKFTHFTWEGFMYREKWERDNEILKTELMMLAHNYDPAYGFRSLTRNSTHYGSQNSWYMYKRYIITTATNEFNSWRIEVHPTAENPEKPYAHAHHTFEVFMPEEFLDGDLFMAENIKPHEEGSKTTLLRQKHVGLDEKNE